MFLYQAIDLDPNNSENILARAAAYFEMGNYDSTLEDANNVLEFDKPSDKVGCQLCCLFIKKCPSIRIVDKAFMK